MKLHSAITLLGLEFKRLTISSLGEGVEKLEFSSFLTILSPPHDPI